MVRASSIICVACTSIAGDGESSSSSSLTPKFNVGDRFKNNV